MKVSKGTNRRVRPLTYYKLWKAHEWKTWMFLWLPILKGVVSPGIYELLRKLTIGILLLLEDVINRENLKHSRKLLFQFCNGSSFV